MEKLARFIAEDVSTALSSYTDKVRATRPGGIGANEPAIRNPRAWSGDLLVEAIATIVLARAMSAL